MADSTPMADEEPRLDRLHAERDALVASGADEEDVDAVDEAIAEAAQNSLTGDGSPRP